MLFPEPDGPERTRGRAQYGPVIIVVGRDGIVLSAPRFSYPNQPNRSEPEAILHNYILAVLGFPGPGRPEDCSYPTICPPLHIRLPLSPPSTHSFSLLISRLFLISLLNSGSVSPSWLKTFCSYSSLWALFAVVLKFALCPLSVVSLNSLLLGHRL